VAYPGILFGGGGSTYSAEDRQRERGSGGSVPLVRGSGDSCNLVFRGGEFEPPQTTPSVRHWSRYRPGVAQGGSRKLRFPDFMTTAQRIGHRDDGELRRYITAMGGRVQTDCQPSLWVYKKQGFHFIRIICVKFPIRKLHTMLSIGRCREGSGISCSGFFS
jgi:hypothetical protein